MGQADHGEEDQDLGHHDGSSDAMIGTDFSTRKPAAFISDGTVHFDRWEEVEEEEEEEGVGGFEFFSSFCQAVISLPSRCFELL